MPAETHKRPMNAMAASLSVLQPNRSSNQGQNSGRGHESTRIAASAATNCSTCFFGGGFSAGSDEASKEPSDSGSGARASSQKPRLETTPTQLVALDLSLAA